MSILTITVLTFREVSRRKILLSAVVLGVLFLVVYSVGLGFVERDIPDDPLISAQIFNFLGLAGLYVVNFLTVMMTVLTSVDTISGEISTGTIQTIITKPIRRWEIMLGKWVGYALMFSLYILMMGGGVVLLIWLISDYTIPNYLLGLLMIWLNGLLMLTISIAGGAIFSTLANGVLVFGLFGVAFVGGWIEQVGSFVENQAAVNIGIISSLIMPSEALWRRAAFEMRSVLVDAIGFSPFTSLGSTPSALMIWYAVGYVVVVLWAGISLFRSRDL